MQFADRWIPEPESFWDSYATRTDALRENQQRVGADLTRRHLKLEPPPDLEGAALRAELQWLKAQVRDDDQFANEQLPNGVDGPVGRLRGK